MVQITFISDDCGQAMFVDGQNIVYTDCDYTDSFVSTLLKHLGIECTVRSHSYQDANGTTPSDEFQKIPQTPSESA